MALPIYVSPCTKANLASVDVKQHERRRSKANLFARGVVIDEGAHGGQQVSSLGLRKSEVVRRQHHHPYYVKILTVIIIMGSWSALSRVSR